jgi:hypothetical protein
MSGDSPVQEIFRRKLVESVWMFGTKPGGLRNAALMFGESGLIENHPRDEEHGWSLGNGRLEILDAAGALHWYGAGRYMENGVLYIALKSARDGAEEEAMLRDAGPRPAPEAAQELVKRTEMSEAVEFEGHINMFQPPGRLVGWAVNLKDPEGAKITVAVRLGEKILGRGVADLHRGDLQRFGSGNYSFDFTCEEPLPYAAILSRQVVVELSVGDAHVGALHFDQTTNNIVSALEIGRLLAGLEKFDRDVLHSTLLHALPHTPEPAASAVQAAVTLMKNFGEIPSFSKFEPGSMTNVAFKTGMISSDCAAVLGQEGHMFLIEGSNNVKEIFEKPYGAADVLETAGRWAEMIKRRRDFSTSQGCAFIQIVIPEKIALMREWLDGNMSSPSALLSALEQKLAEEMEAKHYISGLSVLNRVPYGTAFRKTDSHLVPAAAFAIFREICGTLGINIIDNIPFDIPITVNGDLARRFFGRDAYDVCYLAKEPLFKAGVEMVSSYIPNWGTHVGKRYVFRNEQAPIRKKVILFGNSFFDNHTWQGSVSYWMANWFQEYHFIFTPAIEENYIAEVKPDIVICQTIERFLVSLPAG